MKILIAEDNERMRKFIGQMVRSFADEIFECADGEQAVRAYSDYHPDWVLMDIEMKNMDGITATEQITQKHPDAKILMVTRHDDQKLKERAKKAGACGYLLKQSLHLIEEVLAEGGDVARLHDVLYGLE